MVRYFDVRVSAQLRLHIPTGNIFQLRSIEHPSAESVLKDFGLRAEALGALQAFGPQQFFHMLAEQLEESSGITVGMFRAAIEMILHRLNCGARETLQGKPEVSRAWNFVYTWIEESIVPTLMQVMPPEIVGSYLVNAPNAGPHVFGQYERHIASVQSARSVIALVSASPGSSAEAEYPSALYGIGQIAPDALGVAVQNRNDALHLFLQTALGEIPAGPIAPAALTELTQNLGLIPQSGFQVRGHGNQAQLFAITKLPGEITLPDSLGEMREQIPAHHAHAVWTVITRPSLL